MYVPSTTSPRVPMPAVMPSEWASDSTISTGAADTMYVFRPAWRWRSSRRRASGRILASSFGSTSALRATRSSWRIPATAPRMRSRTPSVEPSLDPRSLKASAARASRANWRVGRRPALRAVVARMNADDPEMSVRSRSKNAALGPELIICPYSVIET